MQAIQALPHGRATATPLNDCSDLAWFDLGNGNKPMGWGLVFYLSRLRSTAHL